MEQDENCHLFEQCVLCEHPKAMQIRSGADVGVAGEHLFLAFLAQVPLSHVYRLNMDLSFSLWSAEPAAVGSDDGGSLR